MTGCAKCGMCCDAIYFPRLKKDMHDGINATVDGDGNIIKTDGPFLREHWHRISKKTASERLGFQGSGPYYECDQYDRETHECMAQDRKPEICAGFPWYQNFYGPDAPKEPERLRSWPRCSFWHDVPRDKWPEGIDPLPDPEAA